MFHATELVASYFLYMCELCELQQGVAIYILHEVHTPTIYILYKLHELQQGVAVCILYDLQEWKSLQQGVTIYI